MSQVEHLDDHPHIFLNSEDIVIGTYVFDGHDHELLDLVKNEIGGESYLCGCDLSIKASNGFKWDGVKFIPPKPENEPTFIYNEEVNEWIPTYPAPDDGKFYIWDGISHSYVSP